MTLEVSKHLLDPHTTPISSQGLLGTGEIGRQQPGTFLASVPVSQQVNGKGKTLRKVNINQPSRVSGLVHQLITALPHLRLLSGKTDAAFLTQDIVPSPLVEVTHQFNRAKFAIPQDQDTRLRWQQRSYI